MPEKSLDPTQIATIGIFAAIVLFEVLFPFRHYLFRLRHYGKNIIFSIVNSLITGFVAAGINVWVFLWIDEKEIGLLSQLQLPFAVTVIIASLIFDAWIYTWHRLNHVVPFFWRFHQVHHNDLEMDMSTALRFHPGEIFLSSMINVGIFLLFGITIELLVSYKLVFNINVLFHHSNIALPDTWDRVLRTVLVSPNMHRVHHSMKVEETNSNYSSVLTIWDRLFGSYRRSDPQNIVFGLEYDRTPEKQSLKYLLLRPFKPRNPGEFPEKSPETSDNPNEP
jgi:sterol desaturase/sphingolipid hydroxylase (fatty acid hydroxylase superfamily)